MYLQTLDYCATMWAMRKSITIYMVAFAAVLMALGGLFNGNSARLFNNYPNKPSGTTANEISLSGAELSAVRINNNSDTLFVQLDRTRGMAVANSELYVADTNGIYQGEKLISPHPALRLSVFGEKLLVLRESGLYSGVDYTPNGTNNNLLMSGNFLSVSAYSDTAYSGRIYLADSATVRQFTATIHAGIMTLSNETIRFNSGTRSIRQVTADSASAFVLVDDGTTPRLRIYRITGMPQGQFLTNDAAPADRIRDILFFDGQLLVLTMNTLRGYSFSGGILQRLGHMGVTDGLSLAAGKTGSDEENKIFIASDFLNFFNVYSVYAELSWGARTLNARIASNSSADYFFDTPMGLSYRFGRIIVADTFNNRVALVSEQPPVEYFERTGMSRPVSAVMTTCNRLIVAANQNQIISREDAHAQIELFHDGYAMRIQKLMYGNGEIFVNSNIHFGKGVHALS